MMSKIQITTHTKNEKKRNTFEGYNSEVLTPKGRKLLKEWKKIDMLCRESEAITYIVRKRNREGLPVEYEIIYHLKSIIGVEEPIATTSQAENKEKKNSFRKPVYGDEHRLSILLPANYPSAYGGNPEFKMLTDTWHPNIRATGKFKGRICLNNKDLGVKVGLDERIIRVGKYLQYQVYWARNSYPWPEDKNVADWVREEAEPNKWVDMYEGIFSDYSPLYKAEKPSKPYDLSENKANGKPGEESENPTIII